YRNLLDRASLTDLKDLCYLMGVDYDNYLGRKDDFVREWLQDMERQNRLAEMISLIRKEKSWILRSN
ncbi:MAG: hypothetical protein KDE09_24705, partial [Anaerolineales bacterium]|nr:hypothetical protein [Anaerolineales bacterium]